MGVLVISAPLFGVGIWAPGVGDHAQFFPEGSRTQIWRH